MGGFVYAIQNIFSAGNYLKKVRVVVGFNLLRNRQD